MNGNNGGGSSNSIGKLILIITAAVLALAIVIGAVAAAFAIGAGAGGTAGFLFDDIVGWIEDLFDGNDSNNGDSGGGSGNKKNPKDTEEDKAVDVVKANISLPVSTPSGSYLISGSAASTIADDVAKSQAAILVNVTDGTVTAGRNIDTKIYPASMTKVMTLLVACENAKEAGKLLTVTQDMIDYKESHGASGNMAFTAGEQISVEDALYLINYTSDTIACLLIAEYISGSEAEFVKLMNAKAAEIGLTNTHFVNTTGLHDPDHYTTCREMAAIMNCALNNSVAAKIIKSYKGRTISVYENNKPSTTRKEPNTVYSRWYSTRLGDDNTIGSGITVIGGKTGYEDIPTSCFVTAAKNSDGKIFICVTVGRVKINYDDKGKEKTEESVSESQSTTDTKKIYTTYAK